MKLCDSCDLEILRGEPRQFIGDDVVHAQCSVVLGRSESVCPPPCNLVHQGSCEF